MSDDETLTVGALIERLQKCDPNLPVYTTYDSLVCICDIRGEKMFIISDSEDLPNGLYIGSNIDADEAKSCMNHNEDVGSITRLDGIPIDTSWYEDDE